MSTSRAPFASRWQSAVEKHGPFCLNLDPTPSLLRAWGVRSGADGLQDFCERVVEVAGPRISMIKPQSAYFERFGPEGVQVLKDVLRAVRSHGALALLDAKRGDIGSTNEGYADGLLGPESEMQADALTVHAYLGFAALRPLVERAVTAECALFPVVLSSNPEGRTLQSARLPDGRSVAEALADEITQCNEQHTTEGVGPIGAVVGVTAEAAPSLIPHLPRSLLLTPGLGAQGGTIEDIALRFRLARGRVIPCAGRSVLQAGPEPSALRTALDEISQATRAALA